MNQSGWLNFHVSQGFWSMVIKADSATSTQLRSASGTTCLVDPATQNCQLHTLQKPHWFELIWVDVICVFFFSCVFLIIRCSVQLLEGFWMMRFGDFSSILGRDWCWIGGMHALNAFQLRDFGSSPTLRWLALSQLLIDPGTSNSEKANFHHEIPRFFLPGKPTSY